MELYRSKLKRLHLRIEQVVYIQIFIKIVFYKIISMINVTELWKKKTKEERKKTFKITALECFL